jgi:hypothetical protein
MARVLWYLRKKKLRNTIVHSNIEMSDEPAQQIIPRIWVGRYAAITSPGFLEKNSIKNVVSVCSCEETLTGYNQLVISTKFNGQK